MIWGEPLSGNHPDDILSRSSKESKGGCQIWGILNVTPDSFSDGGFYLDETSAINHAREMFLEGADVIDVGGESSRPKGPIYGMGAQTVPTEEEVQRVVPVTKKLTQELGIPVSIDTVKAEVAREAISAGASIINDISCGTVPELLNVAAQTNVQLLLMHNRNQGAVTQDNVYYQDVVEEVIIELMNAVERAVQAGVNPMRIWIDPGIGFAKTTEQNLELLAHIDRLAATGYPVLVGPSRKSFIAKVAPHHNQKIPTPLERQGGTAAAVSAAILGGARAIRVHDVGLMRQVARVTESIYSSSPKSIQHPLKGGPQRRMT